MKTSAQITSLFLSRANDLGVVSLTAKQVKWLVDTKLREQKREIFSGRTLDVTDENGTYHTLAIYPNGAGFLKPAVK